MPLIPSTKLVSDVLTAVKRLFGDESGAQLTDADIIRFINQGQLVLATENKYTRTTATTTSVANQAGYTFAGTNILSIEGLQYNTIPLKNQSFEQVQESYLKQFGFTSPPATAIGTPAVWYEYDDTVYLWPPPSVTGDIITLFVATYPTVVASSVDTLSIPDTYYEALIQYVMTQAYELDDDMQSASLKIKQLDMSLSKLASTEKATQNQYYQVITIMADDL